jgi:hypothetical protein
MSSRREFLFQRSWVDIRSVCYTVNQMHVIRKKAVFMISLPIGKYHAQKLFKLGYSLVYSRAFPIVDLCIKSVQIRNSTEKTFFWGKDVHLSHKTFLAELQRKYQESQSTFYEVYNNQKNLVICGYGEIARVEPKCSIFFSVKGFKV